ncbi:hypothetical protein UNSW3_102 [Campylobacter concisus UNSW3]|uniref:Uncharacterized protein n=1 Tax=Campylobacter concisus UNSW3 TaxID=1242966 RepID=U2G114_9BACT|nr:hypothetical protein UNSW3_102 [Campylobacter concisus UNSW3]
MFGKRCGKCGILTATKRVNLHFLANLLSKKPHKFTQNSQI